ncbi:glucose dehydrogenase [FAD, quinone] isoform X2 [Hyalella azteca]|uniref:Glucose dehydrogenase [FAD, quinone] isoform X2 n=1 Tax=Hyalella azteca TaxID=294128 RepID=A0A8B7PHW6_HYAAZ|nr:glucose dehydrogenase [FAD, quinone] isoform X2 [Hyalella azteca]
MPGNLLVKLATSILRILLVSTLIRDVPYSFPSSSPVTGSFDFIVVGGGTAGSAVAARLSETEATVLLLEAGGSAPPESVVPFAWAPVLALGQASVTVASEPEDNAALSSPGRKNIAYFGRVIGGASTVNGMAFVRGSGYDFDSWKDLGNEGWDYRSVLPYFKKLENYQAERTPSLEKYRGFAGPVSVSQVQRWGKLRSAIKAAAAELGVAFNTVGGKSNIGISWADLAVKNGVRSSASESYLRPAATRSNLRVLTRATVTRIIFDEQKKARGVEYTFNGQTHRVVATKEVVLSAGALFTPQLLMLSGVGPPQMLTERGIEVVSALPGVGQNLDNHPGFVMHWRVKPGVTISIKDIFNPKTYIEYNSKRSGVLSGPFGTIAHNFVNLGGGNPDWPDLNLPWTLRPSVPTPNIDKKTNVQLIGLPVLHDTLTTRVVLMRPRSRGLVSLRSADVADPPLIRNNFFQDPYDLKLMVKGIRETFRVMNTSAMREILLPQPDTSLKACLRYGRDTDGYWECFVRHVVGQDAHHCCTAKMSPPTDPMGVVSPRLLVRGVSGLRVVDASVMPHVVSANTMASTYMVAEKASDMIKQDWGYPVQQLY